VTSRPQKCRYGKQSVSVQPIGGRATGGTETDGATTAVLGVDYDYANRAQHSGTEYCTALYCTAPYPTLPYLAACQQNWQRQAR